MDAAFWHGRWERNETAFHQGEANPMLVAHFNDLSLPAGSRIFVPLCGKTRDIHWLLSHNHRVVGAELSEIAVKQLFAELGVEPTITEIDSLRRYSANSIDIFVGDIFSVSRDVLGPVDAIYDRAAFVALPKPMRDRYTAHLIHLTDRAPQLLISYDYDQQLVDGPPFAISNEEVAHQYQQSYDLKLLTSAEVKGGMKGKCPATESLWLLKPHSR